MTSCGAQRCTLVLHQDVVERVEDSFYYGATLQFLCLCYIKLQAVLVDDGVLRSYSGLVDKPEWIQVQRDRRPELLQDEALQGLHYVRRQCQSGCRSQAEALVRAVFSCGEPECRLRSVRKWVEKFVQKYDQ